jgi:hypothetical protein
MRSALCVSLIPRVNDDEKISPVQVLPACPRQGRRADGYHDIAQAKYEALGRVRAGACHPASWTCAASVGSYGLTILIR